LRVAIVLNLPTSERDQIGVDELESQTTNLLSFRPIDQTVFDTQVAFNMLADYGDNAKPSLADIRAAVARNVAHCLEGRATAPAIQIIQAPVFYGCAFNAFAEFTAPVPGEQLVAQLVPLGVRVAALGDPTPSNVSVVGEADIHLARIEADPSVASGVWIWGVADNLRLAAVNAVRIAEALVAEPKIQ
jgi:aspartate-semialdehyde dehydrogenase